MRLIYILFTLFFLPISVVAQDSRFASYDAYVQFIDDKIMNRDFIPLITTLGGKDEYTPQQMQALNAQLLSVRPYDFTDTAVMKKVDLGKEFSQELRVYWNDRNSYIYFYALLHETNGSLIVLSFNLNTTSEKIFSRF